MQFRDALQPLLILSNIVFSFTGVVLMMGVFGLFVNLLGPGLCAPSARPSPSTASSPSSPSPAW
jgi:hypothetical protein